MDTITPGTAAVPSTEPHYTAWLRSIQPRLVALRAQLDREAQDEARARLRAYRLVTCSGERWDRMCALLDLARDNLKHTECRDGDATRCLACGLESAIDEMLKEAKV